MKALIIGCGSIGSRRARILKELGVEVVLCDTNILSHSFTTTIVELGLAAGYTDSDKAIRERGAVAGSAPCDVALICTPPSTHLDIALQCAGQGMHLFIEKPLSNWLDKRRIVQLTYKMQVNGIIGIMGQSYRFCPSLIAWRQQISDKIVLHASINSGQHLSEWTAGDYHTSIYAGKQDGGIVMASLAHSLDQAQWLFGVIDAASGLIANSGELGIEADDTATLLLRMKSGAQVTIHNDFLQRPRRNEIAAMWTGGGSLWNLTTADVDAMYRAEMEHLVKCIEQRYQGQPDIAMGVLNLEWMEAVQRASDTGTWQRVSNFWKEATGRK